MHRYIEELYEKVGEVEQLAEKPVQVNADRLQATIRTLTLVTEVEPEISEFLEIGPASGFITEGIDTFLRDRQGSYLDVMDVSDSFLANVRDKCYTIREYIPHDITSETSAHLASYDFIFFQEVLEHLTSPFTALVNIFRLLKEKGFLYLTIPNSMHWSLLAKRYGTFKGSMLDTHISELSPIGMIKLASMAGFDVMKVDFYATRLPVLRQFSSGQVAFLLRKSATPEERWKTLTSDIVTKWI